MDTDALKALRKEANSINFSIILPIQRSRRHEQEPIQQIISDEHLDIGLLNIRTAIGECVDHGTMNGAMKAQITGNFPLLIRLADVLETAGRNEQAERVRSFAEAFAETFGTEIRALGQLSPREPPDTIQR